MLLICILFRTCFTCRYANEFLPLCSQDEALRIWAMTLDVVKHQIVRAQRKNRTLNRIALLQVSIENLESSGGAGCSMRNHRMQGCDTRMFVFRTSTSVHGFEFHLCPVVEHVREHCTCKFLG